MHAHARTHAQVPCLSFRVAATAQGVELDLDYFARDDAPYTTANNYLLEYYMGDDVLAVRARAVGRVGV
jgi:hypothetical protein